MEILPDSKQFKILLLSNAHWIPSGYGVQCRGMVYAWNRHYNVRMLANYGLQGAWRADGYPDDPSNLLITYPTLFGDTNGDKTARLIFGNWRPDIFITLYDIWMGAYVDGDPSNPAGFRPIHPHWIPLVMVDHDPVPEATLLQAAEAYKVVTPTRFGEEQFRQRGVEATYIPFGIDAGVFKPSVDKQADKKWLDDRSVPFVAAHKTEIKPSDFLVVLCGANKDPYRKAFMRSFIGMQLFFNNNPDARKDTRVYVHSWMKLSRDIPHGAKTLHVEDVCKGANDYHMLCGAMDREMARIYGAADVFLHPSQGGGFEIPILEAMSCGVPVIASDFVGMTELARDHGWLIPQIVGSSGAKSRYFTPLDATQIIVDEFKIAEALEDAYNHSEKRVKLGREGRRFAERFDWGLVNDMWMKFFEEIRGEWHTPPLKERRL